MDQDAPGQGAATAVQKAGTPAVPGVPVINIAMPERTMAAEKAAPTMILGRSQSAACC